MLIKLASDRNEVGYLLLNVDVRGSKVAVAQPSLRSMLVNVLGDTGGDTGGNAVSKLVG